MSSLWVNGLPCWERWWSEVNTILLQNMGFWEQVCFTKQTKLGFYCLCLLIVEIFYKRFSEQYSFFKTTKPGVWELSARQQHRHFLPQVCSLRKKITNFYLNCVFLHKNWIFPRKSWICTAVREFDNWTSFYSRTQNNPRVWEQLRSLTLRNPSYQQQLLPDLQMAHNSLHRKLTDHGSHLQVEQSSLITWWIIQVVKREH